ncbi:MAG: 3-deoxy-D-manno-octulosonic acid transferase, partial [Planctomycetaceae bacterium]|nr:3-deoxy-D-manno-octulosonic acid transferase [Planctomycetaceae bacterium]
MPGLAWLLNGLYVLLLTVVSPVLLYRSITQGKYRDGWREKLLGELPRLPKTAGAPHRPRLWFHAVSVGEVLQLQRLVAEILTREPAAEVVISTTTSTGLAVAREKFPAHTVCYFPLDFSWAVRRAIACIAPDAILLVELELWPNFILAAREAGIPLGLVNGRIGERSFHGYRRIAPLMKRLLACFDLLAMQNWTFASRLERLGAAEDRLAVTGSIKFDHVETSRSTPRTTELRTAFQLADGEPVFIAGSTQAPEEQYALDTWLALREEFPRLRLILVPRHKERFEEVARMVLQHGLPLLRRTATLQIGNGVEAPSSPDLAGSPPVLLLDTLGELSACWGLADV